jgi:hypothetical protein
LGSRSLLTTALVAVLGAGLWAWSRGFDGPYLFDDHVTPLGDPASQSLGAWGRNLGVTLRPLTKLTYALEAETSSGDTPAARRAVSLLLHGVAASLLFVLVRRLAPAASPIPTVAVSTAVAALWFVHPVHADGVLLASGRTAVLSGLLVLGALLALDGSRRWLAAILFTLACFSRETALAALLPLAALAATRHRANWRAVLHDLAPLLLAGAMVVGWMLTTPRYLQLAEYSILGRPFAESVFAQVGAVPVGLGLLLDPSALSIDYGIALPSRAREPLFLLGVLLYVGAAAGVWRAVRRGAPAAAVGLALWLAALLPTQSVIPKLDALANRPLSLALAGILLAAVPLVAAASRRRPSLVLSAAAAIVVALTVATAGRAELFRSELRLWQDAAAKSRANERPHVQVAVLLEDAGREREAQDALATAAAINPFSSQVATLTGVVRRSEVLP